MKPSLDEEIVVLAIADRALRSIWSARLGLAGEIMMIVDNFDDAALDAGMRESATLITDTGAPRLPPSERVVAIRQRGWCNGVILFVCKPHPDIDDPRCAIVLRDSETERVVALLKRWRAQMVSV
ncbi:hypothetical protein [Sphingomonas cavernae]|uniref:Uncharacterized protein n=1 Tax=Sphingomonas cavernae TaxID=2320861 RepID=A0A418W6R5_9SPHN|nr:hypothetical protein [Sphingomonas cavernae]RJF85733.1 hypothetical protein D3876_17750 [Sphingomonas cavernae]